MDEELQELVKKGYKGLQLLAELSKQAASIGYLGDKYSTRYLNKSDYRVPRILNHALTNFGDEFPKPPAGKYYLVF